MRERERLAGGGALGGVHKTKMTCIESISVISSVN
jgi:hypothetical protein